VLTGIGHEVDTSVADLVAYAAFKTPTACAAALVERVGAFRSRLDDRKARLHRASHLALERSSARLARAGDRVAGASRAQLRAATARVDRAELRAGALDPARALARGWSITRDADGRVVRSTADAPAGSTLTTTVADGEVRSTVDG
jgi:exodeoxyribonuclease VII large subunit